jgi:hypothetical protein
MTDPHYQSHPLLIVWEVVSEKKRITSGPVFSGFGERKVAQAKLVQLIHLSKLDIIEEVETILAMTVQNASGSTG